MRLWHKDLLSYLPRNQLLGQWRELNSLYKNENKHILINFAYENKNDLYCYSLMVLTQMALRGYQYNIDNFRKYFGDEKQYKKINKEEVFKNKMNNRYLKQCYYNLEEKYDCGAISNDDWKNIERDFKTRINE